MLSVTIALFLFDDHGLDVDMLPSLARCVKMALHCADHSGLGKGSFCWCRSSLGDFQDSRYLTLTVDTYNGSGHPFPVWRGRPASGKSTSGEQKLTMFA